MSAEKKTIEKKGIKRKPVTRRKLVAAPGASSEKLKRANEILANIKWMAPSPARSSKKLKKAGKTG
jgi:hypothetical protein